MSDDTADPAALRRYRRLLLAHPRWHRRLHGADMLTALLDAAAAAGTDAAAGSAGGIGDSAGGIGDSAGGIGAPARPGREALELLVDGVRCRLRVTGALARLLAATLALVAAGATAAAAGWCAWQLTAAPWPTVGNAVALAAPVVPPGPPDAVTRRDTPLGPWLTGAEPAILLTLLGSPEQRPGGVHLTYLRPRTADRAAAYDVASARLRADGWRTYQAHGWLIADRDGLRITLTYAGFEADTDEMIVAVRPSPPRSAYVLGAVGAGLGTLLGWLMGAAAIARSRHGTSAHRATAAALAIVGAVACLPATLVNLTAVTGTDALTHEGPAPPWAGYGLVLARPAAALGAILLVTAYLVSADLRQPAPTRRSRQPGTTEAANPS